VLYELALKPFNNEDKEIICKLEMQKVSSSKKKVNQNDTARRDFLDSLEDIAENSKI
jgi:hypothetical protein